jgi:hypothetical protein
LEEVSLVSSYSYNDHAKHLRALARCDIQHATSLVLNADVETAVAKRIVDVLDDVERRLFVITTVRGLIFGDDDAELTLLENPGSYDDCRPVTTTCHREDGWMTIVHSPDPGDPSTHVYEFGGACPLADGRREHK